jgi:hypothetical protein
MYKMVQMLDQIAERDPEDLEPNIVMHWFAQAAGAMAASMSQDELDLQQRLMDVHKSLEDGARIERPELIGRPLGLGRLS